MTGLAYRVYFVQKWWVLKYTSKCKRVSFFIGLSLEYFYSYQLPCYVIQEIRFYKIVLLSTCWSGENNLSLVKEEWSLSPPFKSGGSKSLERDDIDRLKVPHLQSWKTKQQGPILWRKFIALYYATLIVSYQIGPFKFLTSVFRCNDHRAQFYDRIFLDWFEYPNFMDQYMCRLIILLRNW